MIGGSEAFEASDEDRERARASARLVESKRKDWEVFGCVKDTYPTRPPPAPSSRLRKY